MFSWTTVYLPPLPQWNQPNGWCGGRECSDSYSQLKNFFPLLLLPNIQWTMCTSLHLKPFKKRGKMVGDNERERRMMGKDNRAASRDDWPSQTVCLCVLQPQATRLDCNNNNADISLAPLFIACTHTHTHTDYSSQAWKWKGLPDNQSPW